MYPLEENRDPDRKALGSGFVMMIMIMIMIVIMISPQFLR